MVTNGAINRKESRGGHTRDDYPGPDPEMGKVNFVQSLDGAGNIKVVAEERPPDATRACKSSSRTDTDGFVKLRIWRGDKNGGNFVEYCAPCARGRGRLGRRPPRAGGACA